MYNMAGTVEETIQRCSAFSPSHTDFRLRKTAWGMEQETQKLYTVTSDSQGIWGQGIQGSCSLHSFLTNSLLSNLSDSLKVNGQSGKKHTHLPPTPHVHQQVHGHSHQVKCFGISELWGERAREYYRILSSLTVLTLTLSVLTSSRTQAKLKRLRVLATCTPLLHLLTNLHCCFSSHRSWVTEP